ATKPVGCVDRRDEPYAIDLSESAEKLDSRNLQTLARTRDCRYRFGECVPVKPREFVHPSKPRWLLPILADAEPNNTSSLREQTDFGVLVEPARPGLLEISEADSESGSVDSHRHSRIV